MSFDLNNGIPRRDFIKQGGRAAAFGLLGEGLYGVSGRVALILDPSDPAASSPQAKWAASELRQAVTAKGATLEIVNSPEAAASDALKIVVAGTGSPMARGFLEAGAAAPLFLMMSGGGLTTIETACRFPIRLVESGPAGGAIFSALIAGMLLTPWDQRTRSSTKLKTLVQAELNTRLMDWEQLAA